jgi:predicted  nucleic acid-binding Zn-ribbon protein
MTQERINELDGEVKMLRLARKNLASTIVREERRLRQMRAKLAADKGAEKIKNRYTDYKTKVDQLKAKLTKANSQILQEELNEMELK